MKNIIFTIFILFSAISLQSQICVGEPGKVQWEVWRGLFSDQFSELSALEFYPSRPDVTQTLYSLNAPINYDNNFGAKISGFIHVPVTDSVTFNITGNSKCQFYLSSSASPSQLTLRAFANDFTNEYENTKFPEQTSPKLLLQSGIFYYFEIRYVESTGSDHCKLFWKNSFISNTNWNIITAAYINDVGCKTAVCPIRGTVCNDGNANTTNDMEDGHCNCVGKPITSNTCVGVRNFMERFRYDNIAGSTINELYLAPNYPGVPTTSSVLPVFGVKSESQISNSGNLVQGYITVPVTGNYKFNVTGDDMTILFISSDDSPENKQAHQVLVSGWTNTTEHNKYIYQSTSNIYMEAGRFYYIELNHKEGTGSEHFAAFWQTPFTGAGVWKRIPSFYFYDYGCDIACIPQGTVCDDGNPFTNNDQYNANCQCEGTPCSGPDCDSPLASYVPYDKCNVTDQLSNRPSNNWLSCNVSNNPNPALPRSHWIKYDLGERHQLISSHIWNYNVLNETNKGFQAVSVDYSQDGTNWTHLDQYNFPLATGEVGYGGFTGPDFTGIFAKYVLISSLDDTTTCRGLGKVAFKAIFCPSEGTLCDDKNPQTINDVYNNQCECLGQNLLINECEDMNLTLGNVTLFTDVYSAVEHVTAISTVDQQSTVGFVGGKSVILDVGFETMPNSVFIASIDTCANNAVMSETPPISSARINTKPTDNKVLMIVPVPDSDMVDIHFNLTEPGKTILKILENNGHTHTITNHEYLNKGHYRKRIRTKKLNSGIHSVTLITSKVSETEKMMVGVTDDTK